MRAPAVGDRMEVISTRFTPPFRYDDAMRGPWARSLRHHGVLRQRKIPG
jgi:hypothetical protein